MPARADEGDALLNNLVLFGRVLRTNGLEVGPQRLETALRGLRAMGLGSRETVYWTLFCTLVSRREEAATFDLAFSVFWDRLLPARSDGSPTREELVPGEPDSPARGGDDAAPRSLPDLPADGDGSAEDADALEVGVVASGDEQLRHVDFSRYGPAELRAARRHLQAIRRATPERRSRRLRAARGGQELDRRRTLRGAMRTEGHPIERFWHERRLVARRLIFLIDVSGSMEPYARALVLFAQVVHQASRKVEVFTFGTRLTRITAELGGRDPAAALTRAGHAIPDWAGGTLIGASVKAFNDTAGRRGLSRGAVVVVVSDGCERADPALLATEMARLHRAAHSVVWVNPLAGDPAYRPLQRGMVAALPFVDVFLPGHDLAAVTSLAAVLEAIPERRRAGTGAARQPTPTGSPPANG